MKSFRVITSLICCLFIAVTASANHIQWAPVDIAFTTAKQYNWRSFPIQVVFTNNQQAIALDAYWDGENNWKVRFAPPTSGTWKYNVITEDAGIKNKQGSVVCDKPSSDSIHSNPNYRGQVKTSANGHYFVYTDNTPVLILADCHVLGSNSYNDFARIVDIRKTMGFNAFDMRLAKRKDSNEGGPTYINKKIDNLNPAYFRVVDRQLQKLWNAGFISIFMPDFMGNSGYTYDEVRDISRYLLARYASYNIIYIITGEYDSKRNEAIWKPLDNWLKLGDYIKSINDKAYKVPLGAHPLTASSSEKLHNQKWLTYNQIQTKLFDEFNQVSYCVLIDYRKQSTKPTFFAEGVYENQTWPPLRKDTSVNQPNNPTHPTLIGSPYIIRHQVWLPLVNGASIVDYGEDHIKSGTLANHFNEIIKAPGAQQAAEAFKIFRSFEWWKLIPQREWVLVNGTVPPLTKYGFSPLPYCIAEEGKTYIIYITALVDADLKITHLKNKAYVAQWYDPRKKKYLDINGGKPINEALKDNWEIPKQPEPEMQDWVLILKAQQ